VPWTHHLIILSQARPPATRWAFMSRHWIATWRRLTSGPLSEFCCARARMTRSSNTPWPAPVAHPGRCIPDDLAGESRPSSEASRTLPAAGAGPM